MVDLGGFILLREMNFSTLPSAAISFSFAAVYNFMLSSAVVFRTGSSWRRFIMFTTFALVGLAINAGVTILTSAWLPDIFAKVLGICMAFGINFWVNNFLVFRHG